ncbi:SubName: Full=Uncharacterized protein {ECO:0000313/EMBL:CCA72802.1} [Serendipita indica DSM 11827]|uniref:Nuclear speckle splicing regulatory protein 1 N-terminal domain-containing protein n=1 Tax=Serendipita indica (strain DSM 11827) TaxID=1109443 RepID=G4TNA9_SERID|nr:SubName: Full=Uncharacterized protein {ECO:0000313/EMBL:CCA72802.1} [Serendipita indica DSM 11827]CCA72802.1 hypothetical protein PIIN_06738 [Serendipita indica DSM 11827]
MESTTPAKVSFSLKAKPKPKPVPPVAPQTSAFGSFDGDEEPLAPKLSRPDKSSAPLSMVPKQGTITKAMKREMEQQKKVDATVYLYDEVYDNLKEAERINQAAKEEEAKTRQPKYIGNLLQAADQRKRDHLIAEEKLIQRERELEGDEFVGKAKFVTQAYKDQLAANRKAEEEEKLREEQEKKQKGKSGPGMTHFYASLLKQSEEKHNAILSASKSIIGPTMPPESVNLAIKPPTEPKDLTDVERARLALAEGKQVELNDDNQIVDKRELLSAGLNLGGKNTRDLAAYRRSKEQQKDTPVNAHTAVGAAASRREIDARRRKEVEDQLAEEEERRVREREREEEEARQRAVKRKNDDEAVMSARERYLERKRRKLEAPPPEDDD